MSTFFSGTDWAQLEDRANASVYCLMLITNFKNEHIAKIAFKAQTKVKSNGLSFVNDLQKNTDNLDFSTEEVKDVLCIMDCNIEIEPQKEDVYIPNELMQDFKNASKNLLSNKTTLKQIKDAIEKELSKIDVSDYFIARYEYVKKETESVLFPTSNVVSNYIPKKNVMAMTDAEWHKSEVVTVGLQEGFALLNYFLDKKLKKPDYNSPIEKLTSKDKKLTTYVELVNYLQTFEVEFPDLFDKHFPHINALEYDYILEELIEYLQPFKHIRLIKELIDTMNYMQNL